jgi:hypothetical protein
MFKPVWVFESTYLFLEKANKRLNLGLDTQLLHKVKKGNVNALKSIIDKDPVLGLAIVGVIYGSTFVLATVLTEIIIRMLPATIERKILKVVTDKLDKLVYPKIKHNSSLVALFRFIKGYVIEMSSKHRFFLRIFVSSFIDLAIINVGLKLIERLGIYQYIVKKLASLTSMKELLKHADNPKELFWVSWEAIFNNKKSEELESLKKAYESIIKENQDILASKTVQAFKSFALKHNKSKVNLKLDIHNIQQFKTNGMVQAINVIATLRRNVGFRFLIKFGKLFFKLTPFLPFSNIYLMMFNAID